MRHWVEESSRLGWEKACVTEQTTLLGAQKHKGIEILQVTFYMGKKDACLGNEKTQNETSSGDKQEVFMVFLNRINISNKKIN